MSIRDPKIISFPGITRLDSNPDHVLESAIGELDSVLIIGYHKDGGEYFATSLADGGDALWLAERFKKALLAVPEDMES